MSLSTGNNSIGISGGEERKEKKNHNFQVLAQKLMLKETKTEDIYL